MGANYAAALAHVHPDALNFPDGRRPENTIRVLLGSIMTAPNGPKPRAMSVVRPKAAVAACSMSPRHGQATTMFTAADLRYLCCAAALRGLFADQEETTMTNGSTLSLSELEDRIAIVRDNIRQLIEQAAAFSGAADEDRNADRLAEQNEELDRLTKQRDALLKK